MINKRTLLVLILITTVFSFVHSQTPDIKARSAFHQAKTYFEEQKYQDAIYSLNKVIDILGGTNPRVEFLKIKSYTALKDIPNLEKSLANYFEVASEQDPNYNNMLLRYASIEDIRNQIQEEKREEQMWLMSKKQMTFSSFKKYLMEFPEGKYITEAKEYEFRLTPKTMKDPRDGKSYRLTRIDHMIWMAENLNYSKEGSVCRNGKNQECNSSEGRYYSKESAQSACPEGWRLPTLGEWEYINKRYDNNNVHLIDVDAWKHVSTRGVANSSGLSIKPTASYSAKREAKPFTKSGAYFWAQDGEIWQINLITGNSRFEDWWSLWVSCRCIME